MVRVRLLVFALLALVGVSLAPRSALAATELYLQFDPALAGSAKETTHPGWAQVDSYTMASPSPTVERAAGAGAAAGRSAAPTKITIVTSDPSVLTQIREASAKGTHFKMAVLDVKKPASQGSKVEYVKITMADVMVSSLEIKPAQSGKPISATFTLAFAKMTMEYSTADGSGTRSAPAAVPATWNIATAKTE